MYAICLVFIGFNTFCGNIVFEKVDSVAVKLSFLWVAVEFIHFRCHKDCLNIFWVFLKRLGPDHNVV
jgi:hypothetical protein